MLTFLKNKKISTLNYFNEIKNSLYDPLARDMCRDVNWISTNLNDDCSKYPIVIGGKGDPILLIHGFDSCFLEFRRIYPLLKSDFQLIIPDLLGFGFTPRSLDSNYNPSTIIYHLETLIEKLGINKKIKIVGASMGSSVALSLSKRLKSKVDRIVLLSPAGLFEKPKKIPFPLNQLGAAFLSIPQVRKNLCRQAFAYPNKSVGLMEEQIASIHLGCDGWRNSLASFAKSGGFGESIKDMQDLPTKTICGFNDRILGEKELLKINSFKQLNSFILQNCGHLPHLDLPFLVDKIIKDFFSFYK